MLHKIHLLSFLVSICSTCVWALWNSFAYDSCTVTLEMLGDTSASVASLCSPVCCSLTVCADCLLQSPWIFNLHSVLVCITDISGVYLISSRTEKAFCFPTLGALLVSFASWCIWLLFTKYKLSNTNYIFLSCGYWHLDARQPWTR